MSNALKRGGRGGSGGRFQEEGVQVGGFKKGGVAEAVRGLFMKEDVCVIEKRGMTWGKSYPSVYVEAGLRMAGFVVTLTFYRAPAVVAVSSHM